MCSLVLRAQGSGPLTPVLRTPRRPPARAQQLSWWHLPGETRVLLPILTQQQTRLTAQEELERLLAGGSNGTQAWPPTQSSGGRLRPPARSVAPLPRSAASAQEGPRAPHRPLHLRPHPPEHIVPVLLHVGHVVEGDVQDLADPVRILAVSVGRANALLLHRVPVLHEHPRHLVTCGRKGGQLKAYAYNESRGHGRRLLSPVAVCYCAWQSPLCLQSRFTPQCKLPWPLPVGLDGPSPAPAALCRPPSSRHTLAPQASARVPRLEHAVSMCVPNGRTAEIQQCPKANKNHLSVFRRVNSFKKLFPITIQDLEAKC